MLGLASFSMEGDLTDTPGLQTTSVDFHMDMSSAGPQNNLVVGLLGSGGWYNNGFQSLNFQASVEGVTVIDISFADLISADNYFSDKTLFLGDWTQLISNDNILDLAFLVSMTGQWGDSFSTNLIVGTTMTETGNPVPLPPALWLLISGLLGVFSFGCKRKDKGTGD